MTQGGEMEFRAPGNPVRIHRIDTEGLAGREPHPPVIRNPGSRPTSPCDGQVAYVIGYMGWERGDGTYVIRDPDYSHRWLTDSVVVDDTWPDEQIFTPGEALRGDDDDSHVTHYWKLVVPRIGVFDFADYELADSPDDEEEGMGVSPSSGDLPIWVVGAIAVALVLGFIVVVMNS